MRCEKIRNLLITDCLDNELSFAQRKRVENHLSKCRSCASYAESVYQLSIKSLRDAKPVKVPVHTWERVKSSIKQQNLPSITILDRIQNGFARIFTMPKPALAFATVAVVVLISIFVVRSPLPEQTQLNQYLSEQVDFLGELNGNNSLSIGIPIEALL